MNHESLAKIEYVAFVPEIGRIVPVVAWLGNRINVDLGLGVIATVAVKDIKLFRSSDAIARNSSELLDQYEKENQQLKAGISKLKRQKKALMEAALIMSDELDELED